MSAIVALIFVVSLATSKFSIAVEKPKDDGIGGTGMVLSPGDDGIGGTGIIGTITEFGSIFVNGQEIDYDRDQTVMIDGIASSNKALKIGHVVKVVATNSDNHLVTNSISIDHEVIGPISAIDHDKATATVLGQPVIMSARKKMGPFKIGDWVAVSGLRRTNGTIVASLVEPSTRGKIQVIGTAKQQTEALNTLKTVHLSDAVEGRQRLRGVFQNGVLIDIRLDPAPLFTRADKVTRVIAEEFISSDRHFVHGDIFGKLPLSPNAAKSVPKQLKDRLAIVSIIQNGTNTSPVVDAVIFPSASDHQSQDKRSKALPEKKSGSDDGRVREKSDEKDQGSKNDDSNNKNHNEKESDRSGVRKDEW
jgi:hypothetical protein